MVHAATITAQDAISRATATVESPGFLTPSEEIVSLETAEVNEETELTCSGSSNETGDASSLEGEDTDSCDKVCELKS